MNFIAHALAYALIIAPFYTATGSPKTQGASCAAMARSPMAPDSYLSPRAAAILSEFEGMPTYMNPMQSIESLIQVKGKADPQLTHHKSFLTIAESENRLFENPHLQTLPPGVFPFVLLEDNTLIFGLDDTGLEIGVKHFQLAQGRAVRAAGEFDTRVDQFNVESGSFMKRLRTMEGYSQERAIQILARFFSELRGRNVDYTSAILVQKPKSIASNDLKKYCWQEAFAKLHPVICGNY